MREHNVLSSSRTIVLPILFILLAMLTLHAAVPQVTATSSPIYTPGVQPGDQAIYGQVSASWSTNIPNFQPPSIIAPYLRAKSISILVQTVTGTVVTEEQTLNFTDQTQQTGIVTGDIATGQGNLSFFVIGRNLQQGTPIYNSTPPHNAYGPLGVPIVNYTRSQGILGVSRMIDVYNASIRTPATNVTLAMNWDQATGILVKGIINFNVTRQFFGFTYYAKGTGHITLTDTNLWSATPDFRINVNNLTPTVKTDTLYKVNLTVWSLGGFTGQVTLTSSTNSQLLVPQPSPQTVTLIADGSATSQLAIVPAPVQAEGVYSLNITGTDQSSHFHSLTVSVQVSGDFSLQQLAYPVVSAGLGSVVIAVIIHSYSLSGPVHLTATVSPPGPQVVLTNADPSLTPGLRTWTNATISANSSTASGTYTLTITATKGSLLHSTSTKFTVYPAPAPAAVSKILGLDPPVFYGIIGVAIGLAVIVIVQRRRPDIQKLIPSSAATS